MLSPGFVAKRLSAALSIVGTSGAGVTSTTGTLVTPAEPTGAQQNDILVAVIAVDNQSTENTPSLSPAAGWSAVGNGVDAGDVKGAYWVYIIRRGASAPAMGWSAARSSDTVQVGVSVYAVRGVSAELAITSTYENYSGVIATGTGVGYIAPISVSTAGTNRMMLSVTMVPYYSGSSSPDNGWTEDFEGFSGNLKTILDSQLRPTAGTTQTRTTITSSSTYFTQVALAIKPS